MSTLRSAGHERRGQERPDVRFLLRAPFFRMMVKIFLFDEHNCCVAANGSLTTGSDGCSEQHIGQRISQILGRADASIETAFERVRGTGEAVRSLELSLEAPSGERKLWSVDVFPACNTLEHERWVGLAFTEVTRTNELRIRLSALSTRLEMTASDGDSEPFEYPRRFAEVFERSVRLLHHSMSVRRRVSQTWVASSLRRGAWYSPHMRPLEVLHPEETHETTETHAGTAPETGTIPKGLPLEDTARGERPSHREMEVVKLLAEGKSNKEIGTILQLSTRTVETYRARIMIKLNVHSVAEVVRYAVRSGLVEA
jgi:DNA-binding CsgD family transcriptional regulator